MENEEKDLVLPLTDEEIDQVAGGTGETRYYRCTFCQQRIPVTCGEDVKAHLAVCERNPCNKQ